MKKLIVIFAILLACATAYSQRPVGSTLLIMQEGPALNYTSVPNGLTFPEGVDDGISRRPGIRFQGTPLGGQPARATESTPSRSSNSTRTESTSVRLVKACSAIVPTEFMSIPTATSGSLTAAATPS